MAISIEQKHAEQFAAGTTALTGRGLSSNVSRTELFAKCAGEMMNNPYKSPATEQPASAVEGNATVIGRGGALATTAKFLNIFFIFGMSIGIFPQSLKIYQTGGWPALLGLMIPLVIIALPTVTALFAMSKDHPRAERIALAFNYFFAVSYLLTTLFMAVKLGWIVAMMMSVVISAFALNIVVLTRQKKLRSIPTEESL